MTDETVEEKAKRLLRKIETAKKRIREERVLNDLDARVREFEQTFLAIVERHKATQDPEERERLRREYQMEAMILTSYASQCAEVVRFMGMNVLAAGIGLGALDLTDAQRLRSLMHTILTGGDVVVDGKTVVDFVQPEKKPSGPILN
jgi:Flp pilus assembly protein TadB